MVSTHEVFIYLTESNVTADFIVDCVKYWWVSIRARFEQVDTLVMLLDNGPENNSRRTQFMARIVEFVRRYRIRIILAYYPPYHTKYNPVERVWGVLEKHWSAALNDL